MQWSSRVVGVAAALVGWLGGPAGGWALEVGATNLVTDDQTAHPAVLTDTALVNPWGVSHGPTTPFWVSDNGTDASTLYAADGTLLELTRSGDARPYNRVVVVVESPDGAAVVRTEVLITDPASPIHPDAIGIQTAPIARLTAGGQAEANAYARSLLVQYSLLIGDTVSGTAIPDHAIEAGDVVTFDESVSGASDRYIVDQVQHPVTTGPMSITATRVLPVFASGET
jgi:hypothetical protein